MKKEINILIGPAAIGKTTYATDAFYGSKEFRTKTYFIVSRDEIVQRISQSYSLAYDELYLFPPMDAEIGSYIPGFENYGKVISSPKLIQHLQPRSYEYINDINTEIYYAFYNEFQYAIRNKDIDYIIVDRVHLRKEERVAYFKYLRNREDFQINYILFNFQDPDTLNVIEQLSEIRRQRMEKIGGNFRTVPRHVQENMIKFYEEPTPDEYDNLIKVDTLPSLRKLINKK